MTDGQDAAPVPQRLTLVLPSTGEFDSRTYRIASAAVARGHTVTVIARWRRGLRPDERHAAGYQVLRVPYPAIEGLPLPGLARAMRAVVRRLHAVTTRTPYRPGLDPMAEMRSARIDPGVARTASGDDALGTGADAGGGASPGPSASMAQRAASSAVRKLAIPLTIRAQGRFAAQVAPPADLYHGMAYMGIPIALRLARRDRAKVVYDARDIYLDAANLARVRGPMRGLIARAERRWARAADRVVTVNEPYAKVMAGRFGVPKPLVVLNCSYRFAPGDPRPRRFHDALGLATEAAVVLYQGGLSPERGIEQLMEAIARVPGGVLVLMGYGNLEGWLRDEEARADGRIRVLPAVQPTDLLGWVASADVVAMPIQPTTLNHRLTTPNKLFEAMAAGVPIVASDLPGMAPYVREADCGVVCDPTDPAALAAAIRSILDAPADERARLGANALRAAHDRYNWETQVARLFAEYGRLTGMPW